MSETEGETSRGKGRDPGRQEPGDYTFGRRERSWSKQFVFLGLPFVLGYAVCIVSSSTPNSLVLTRSLPPDRETKSELEAPALRHAILQTEECTPFRTMTQGTLMMKPQNSSPSNAKTARAG